MCYNTYGVQTVPLLYIIREKSTLTPEVGPDRNITYNPCLPDKAHGTSGSVLEDMIHRTSHANPLYKQDNASGFQ